MSSIAMHMRMTGLQVTNDDVDARKKAITDLAGKWGKVRSISGILGKSSEICQALHGDGHPPSSLGEEVEAVVQDYASAFLYLESPLEVGICAGSAILELLDGGQHVDGWAIADVYATAIWCALSFQPPLEDAKREALRVEVMEACQARSVESAEAARLRSTVPDFGDFGEAQGEDAKPVVTFKKATSTTITALRRNAALDREELDFLWWAQVTRSRLLGKPFHQISEPVRVVACGIEAASRLRRLPCDVHRDIALRTLEGNPELDLGELLVEMGENRVLLAERYQTGTVAEFPGLFPLLHALASGSAVAHGTSVKRSCEDWGARALLEAGLVQMCSTGAALL